MSRRKAFPRFSSKRYEKKKTATHQQKGMRIEKECMKAHRRKHAAKLAGKSASPPISNPEPLDVYTFPPPSPGSASTIEATESTIVLEKDNEEEFCKKEPCDQDDTAPGHIMEQFLVVPSSIQEDTSLNIICAFPSVEETKEAVENVLRRAAASAKPGDEFGIQSLRDSISRLAKLPIDQAWLAKVIDLLQQELERVCDRAVCQVRSLGKSPLTSGEASDSANNATQSESMEQPDTDMIIDQACDPIEAIFDATMSGALPASNEAEHEDASVTLADDGAKPDATLDDAANFEVAIEHEDMSVTPAQVKQKKQKKKKKQAQDSSSPATAMHDKFNEGPIAVRNGPPQWEPNNGTTSFYVARAPMNTNLDLFVRSAVDAHCFASDESPANIAAFTRDVRRAWTTIQPEQRAGWLKLFNSLPEDETMSVRGQKLLKSQGLLATILPDV